MHQEMSEMSEEQIAFLKLKVWQENHKIQKDINKIIVKASYDTLACYRVIEWAKIVLLTQTVKGEELKVLQERMKTF